MVAAIPERGVFRLTSGQQEAIKWFAIVVMVLDHVAAVLIRDPGAYVAIRVFARVATPLFFFLVAYNITERDVPPSRYYGPLALLMLASQLPYIYSVGFGSNWNIGATLLAGVMFLDAFTPGAGSRRRVLLFLGAVLLCLLGEYSFAGALLVPGFALLLMLPTLASVLVVSVLLLWLNPGHLGMAVPLLSLPLIFLVSRLPLAVPRGPRFAFYVFYPAHLAVLAALRAWL